jgi:hypothetical protein
LPLPLLGSRDGGWNHQHDLDNAGFIGCVGVHTVTTAEKETIVQGWPHPFPETLEVFRRTRDDMLNTPSRTEDEKREIRAEYEAKLNRMFEGTPI